jgi:hypothetical protein
MLVVMEVPPNNPDCPQCRLLLKIIEQHQEQIKRREQRLEAVEREGKRQRFVRSASRCSRSLAAIWGDDYGKHQRRAIPGSVTSTGWLRCQPAAITSAAGR